MNQKLGMKVYLDTDYETALEQVAEALKVEGFGVLTEIDVKATFKKKLDVDFRNYKILGACNPTFAHKALLAAPEVGLLLPCNVTVSEEDDGKILVHIINPAMMMSVIENSVLTDVAADVKERLNRVAEALAK